MRVIHRLACERCALCDGERSVLVHCEFGQTLSYSQPAFAACSLAQMGETSDYVINDRCSLFSFASGVFQKGTKVMAAEDFTTGSEGECARIS